MSKTVTNILKQSGIGNKTIAIKQLLQSKAYNNVKNSYPTIKKELVNRYINEKKNLKESSVYDSIVDYAKNSTPNSLNLPAGEVLNVKFNDKSSAEISIKDAKAIKAALDNIPEPIVKQQLITKMDTSAEMFLKVKNYLQLPTSRGSL